VIKTYPGTPGTTLYVKKARNDTTYF